MEIIFNDLSDFVCRVSPFVLDKSLVPNIDAVISYANNVQNGCKCQLTNRQNNARKFYNELGAKLIPAEKDFLKVSFNTTSIIAKENNNVVWEIS